MSFDLIQPSDIIPAMLRELCQGAEFVLFFAYFDGCWDVYCAIMLSENDIFMFLYDCFKEIADFYEEKTENERLSE